MAAQYAYVMKDMTKTFPGAQKPVLSNIDLQFYQGAKIGIVRPNGAGKSTLIKIMAGIDKDFTGEAWPGENITVGYLEQEPELDPALDVMGNVMEGVAHKKAILDEYRPGRAVFIDDLAQHHGSAAELVPHIDRLHLCGEPTLAPHITCGFEAGHAHARIDTWEHALPWLLSRIQEDHK